MTHADTAGGNQRDCFGAIRSSELRPIVSAQRDNTFCCLCDVDADADADSDSHCDVTASTDSQLRLQLSLHSHRGRTEDVVVQTVRLLPRHARLYEPLLILILH